MNRMMFRNALAFTLALVACNSIAASFDCSKAANFAESSICKDGYLRGVDSILGRAYQKALAETEHPDGLRQSQREWLSVRDQCATQKCLDQTVIPPEKSTRQK
ncbi:lysozyme inhibitor LprI family protein [Pseudomonas synxantha]|uniref:lysozyme inhibitor LprI family protein n=1 Tax=Pseudomonas synxantha TaxID=47883 RepID=UPI00061460CD|nr:lysozyme inhibitor LprI family protein [Pseudomonas synxantha]